MKKYIALLVVFLFPALSFAVETVTTSVGSEVKTNSQSSIIGDDAPSVDLCVDLKNNLYLRSTDSKTNDEVSLLQDFLSDKYFKQEPTGYFGQATLRAVRNFQKQNNIKDSGYVGPITRAKIKDISCNSSSTQRPTISSIDPSIAKVGQGIVLMGQGLNLGGDYVLFDGYRVETDGSEALNRIRFVIPEGLSKADDRIVCVKAPCESREKGYYKKVAPGKYNVQVVNKNGKSNVVKIEVTDGSSSAKPEIKAVNPSKGIVGQPITITGSNINTGNESIYFGESKIVQESFAPNGTNNVLTFRVPEYITRCGYMAENFICKIAAQKVTPGKYDIVVRNKNGISNVFSFEVVSSEGKAPIVTDFSPKSGTTETKVTVSGSNLNTGTEYVLFDQVKLPVEYSPIVNQLVFSIPKYYPWNCPEGMMCPAVVREVSPGTYGLQVGNSFGLSAKFDFTIK